ncbi:STAS-like domain-containing protein [Emticicia sediminis]
METILLSVAKDFSTTPGPRYDWEGSFCGEHFRENVLKPKIEEALKGNKKLKIDLDGTAGFGTSFLEEAFGGLVRNNGYTSNQILDTIDIKSEEEDFWIERIKEYIVKAG